MNLRTVDSLLLFCGPDMVQKLHLNEVGVFCTEENLPCLVNNAKKASNQ